MQQVQNRLDFKIETPDDQEMARRFAQSQEMHHAIFGSPAVKHTKRKRKGAKKLARTNKQFKKAKYKRSLIPA